MLIRELWPAIERALAWIDGPGDRDGDGFVEYARGAETGLSNQGWKDSFDSVFHADGRLAEGPIALVEVQGYVYAAKTLAAFCARALGYGERAAELEAGGTAARAVRGGVLVRGIGTYALALDGEKRPCKVRTSNAGQALFTGIARPDRAHRVAAALFGPPFYSGWGIRTVARGEARYNPMSYHNGSIWPHDNALIARAWRATATRPASELMFEALMRATTYMEHRRLPELYCGFRRRQGRGPTLYPAACSPQAWASGAPFMMLQAMLGLEFDHAAHRIELVNPIVPDFVGDIFIRNLRLGDATADFAVRQDRGAISIQVLRATPACKCRSCSILFPFNAGFERWGGLLVHIRKYEHRGHDGAMSDRPGHGTERGDLNVRYPAERGLQVWAVSLAKGKPHSELRIELGELVQARELLIAAGARADI